MAITRKNQKDVKTKTTASNKKLPLLPKKVKRKESKVISTKSSGFVFEDTMDDIPDTTKKVKKPVKPKPVNIDKDQTMTVTTKTLKRDLTKIFDALNAQLETVSADSIIKAILSATDETVNKKDKKDKKDKVKPSKTAEFQKVTREFGFKLKDGRADPSELKEKFKDNLDRAKADFPDLRVSHFNKLAQHNSDVGIVSGIRKAKGEWIFICYDNTGKKINIPVSAMFK